MATLKICTQKQRKDGWWPVYIRVTHRTKVAYLKTDKMVGSKGITKTGEVKDPYVLKELSGLVVEYMERLNKKDIKNWTVQEVAEYLQKGDEDLCFSDYARKHIDNMIDAGHERNAKNYKAALQSMEMHAGTNRIMFSMLTSQFVERWIQSLMSRRRAKEMYPVCLRQVFKAALVEYNDHDNGIIRIKTNPWVKVKIPKADRADQIAITPEACRAFFSAPLPETRMIDPLPELGRDVAKMVLCLAGINTVDLYNLRKEDYKDGIIRYKRAKTTRARADHAYLEMRVPPILAPLFEKYAAPADDDRLFDFHNRYSTSDSFCANTNSGIKKVCKSMGLPQSDWYCVYTFRHTWGTVAQNDCGATLDEIAFAMNHSSAHRVTRGYVRVSFAPAWELNEKVVEFVFFTEKPSAATETPKNETLFRLSPKRRVKGEAFFKGRCLAEVDDIGFSNVDEVINLLVGQLPDTIPERASVQFRISDVDHERSMVYERTKGKGF